MPERLVMPQGRDEFKYNENIPVRAFSVNKQPLVLKMMGMPIMDEKEAYLRGLLRGNHPELGEVFEMRRRMVHESLPRNQAVIRKMPGRVLPGSF